MSRTHANEGGESPRPERNHAERPPHGKDLLLRARGEVCAPGEPARIRSALGRDDPMLEGLDTGRGFGGGTLGGGGLGVGGLGVGIAGTRERVRPLGGRLEVEDTAERGGTPLRAVVSRAARTP